MLIGIMNKSILYYKNIISSYNFAVFIFCFQKIEAISSRHEFDNNLLRAITYLQIENILIKQSYFIANELEEFRQLDHFFKVNTAHEKLKSYSYTVTLVTISLI